jgi:hypothetical protein
MLMVEVFALAAFSQTLPDANLVNTPTAGAPGPLPPTGASVVQWGHDDTVVHRNIWGWTTGGGNQVPYNYGYGICNGLTPGSSVLGTAITPGMYNFGPSNFWHHDVTSDPVDPNSATILAFIATSTAAEGAGYYHQGALNISSIGVAAGEVTLSGVAGNFAPTVGRTVVFAGTGLSWLDGHTATVASVIGSVLGGASTTGITTTVPSGAPSSYGPTVNTGTATTNDTPAAMGPNFGSSQGIPFSIVDSSITPLQYIVNTNGMFDPLVTQSDDPAMPAPSYMPIEGLPGQCAPIYGDQHAILLDKATCWEYEMFQATSCNGAFTNGGSDIWDLTSYNAHPIGWSSVDAAGLTVFAGLLRHDEVAYGNINHAIRMTFLPTHDAFVYPATHWAGDDHGSTYNYGSPIPMGMRLRLKSTFNMSGFSAQNQVILRALQQYGGIVADNGANMFLTGTVDPGWDNSDLGDLHHVTSDDFEVIQMPAAYTVLNPGYQVTLSACADSSLNGTYVNTYPGRGWAEFTANISHANYGPVSNTCTATMNFPSGSVFTLPATWSSPLATVQVSGGVLTGTFPADWAGSPTAGSNLPNSSASPVISAFTATPSSITSGQSSVLAWTASGQTYGYLTQCDTGCPGTGSANPQVGVLPRSGASVTVTPTVTTTYTLNMLNAASQYAITQQSVTVTVH